MEKGAISAYGVSGKGLKRRNTPLRCLAVVLLLAGLVAGNGRVNGARADTPGPNIQFEWAGFLSPYDGQTVDPGLPLTIQLGVDSAPDELPLTAIAVGLSSSGHTAHRLTLKKAGSVRDANGIWEDVYVAQYDPSSDAFGAYTLTAKVSLKGKVVDTDTANYTLAMPGDLPQQVYARGAVYGLGGGPPPPSPTLDDLRTEISNVVGQYYDPENGKQYSVVDWFDNQHENVLTKVLGKPNWSDSSAPLARQAAEIEKVIAVLTWRKEMDGQELDTGGALVKEASTGIGPATGDCSGPNSGVASAASGLYDTAMAGPAYISGQEPDKGNYVFNHEAGTQVAWFSPDNLNNDAIVNINHGYRPLGIEQIQHDSQHFGIANLRFQYSGATYHNGKLHDPGDPMTVVFHTRPVAHGWTPQPSDWAMGGGWRLLGVTPALPVTGDSLYGSFDMPLSALYAPGTKKVAQALVFGTAGQEPPPGWPPSTSTMDCGDWEESATISSWVLLYQINFSPGSHIGQIHTDYSQYEINRKALQQQIAREQSKLTDLQASYARLQTDLGPKQAALARAVAVTESLAAQKKAKEGQLYTLLNTEPKIPAKYQNYVASLDNLKADLQSVQDKIDAGPSDSQLKALVTQRDDDEQRIATIEAIIQAHIDKPDKAQETQLRRAIAALDDTYWNAVRSQSGTQNDVNGQQSTLSKRLAEIDTQQAVVDTLVQDLNVLNAQDSPLVTRVTIHSGSPSGPVVYDAQKWVPWDGFALIDKAFSQDEQDLQDLTVMRDAARSDYISAEQDALSANQTVYKAIWGSALAQAAVETGYFIYDVADGWKKGGPFGALFEAGKKLVDNYLFNDGIWFKNFDQTDMEKAFNKEYNAGLAYESDHDEQAMVGNAAYDAFEKKLAKDLTTKPVKNAVNGTAGVLAHTLYMHHYKLPQLQKALDVSIVRAERVALRKAVAAQETQLEGLLKNSFSLKKEITSLLTKELPKALVKAQIKQAEQDAWFNFFLKDAIARVRARTFMDLSGAYWKLYDQVQFERALRQQMVSAYDFSDDYRVLINSSLGTSGTDYIVLTLQNGQGHAATVSVNGIKAKLAGSGSALTYAFSPSALPSPPPATIPLSISMTE